MHFTDTHIHLQAYKEKTAPQVIAEAVACGVNQFVCAAITEADWPIISDLTRRFPVNIYPAFGIHPWYLETAQPGWQERLRQILTHFPLAMIGETGLDRRRDPQPDAQMAAFQTHLDLAREMKRPLLIHAVKASSWLEELWPKLSEVRFVMHSFNSRRELMDRALAAGGYISFSESILNNRDFVSLAKAIPADRLLFETDGPFQGNGNAESHPCQIPSLCAKIAEVRGLSSVHLAATVEQNFQRFLNV